MNENIKAPKLGPHEYGSVPTFKNLEKFVRDSRIHQELPTIVNFLNEEEKLPGRKGAFIIRLLCPFFLVLALGIAFYSFYTVLQASNGYGMNYKLAENTIMANQSRQNMDASVYTYTAKTNVAYQIIALRGGQGGQQYKLSVFIPPASQMINGAIVVVRMASIWVHGGDLPAKNYDQEPQDMEVNFLDTVNPISKITLRYRQSLSLISIIGEDGIQRWYNGKFFIGLNQ